MLDTTPAFQHLGFDSTCRIRAVQEVSTLVLDSNNQLTAAKKVIHDMLGVDIEFKEARRARLTAMKVAELIVIAKHHIEDTQAVVDSADAYVTKFMADPDRQWMFAEAESTASGKPTTSQAVVEGIETKVEVKADGSIKKGGKQVLVAEMYKKNVLEATTPMTNQQFIALIVKDLGMSKAGATTYAYNAKKELGEPEGGIVKAKKGRKPKEVV